MNVDGSSTVQTFGLRGTGAPPGVQVTALATRIIFQCITAAAVNLTTFGDIVGGLARGLVLRKRNGNLENIFNVKTNGEIDGISLDWTPYVATNPAQGVDGFSARLTFGGLDKIGSVIELPLGEDLEFLVQDNLTGLTKLEIVAEGHLAER
jgi:hypothetical protein